jgi:hypothetical protein
MTDVAAPCALCASTRRAAGAAERRAAEAEEAVASGRAARGRADGGAAALHIAERDAARLQYEKLARDARARATRGERSVGAAARVAHGAERARIGAERAGERCESGRGRPPIATCKSDLCKWMSWLWLTTTRRRFLAVMAGASVCVSAQFDCAALTCNPCNEKVPVDFIFIVDASPSMQEAIDQVSFFFFFFFFFDDFFSVVELIYFFVLLLGESRSSNICT